MAIACQFVAADPADFAQCIEVSRALLGNMAQGAVMEDHES